MQKKRRPLSKRMTLMLSVLVVGALASVTWTSNTAWWPWASADATTCQFFIDKVDAHTAALQNFHSTLKQRMDAQSEPTVASQQALSELTDDVRNEAARLSKDLSYLAEFAVKNCTDNEYVDADVARALSLGAIRDLMSSYQSPKLSQLSTKATDIRNAAISTLASVSKKWSGNFTRKPTANTPKDPVISAEPTSRETTSTGGGKAPTTYAVSPNEADKTTYKCATSNPSSTQTFRVATSGSSKVYYWLSGGKEYEIGTIGTAAKTKLGLSAEQVTRIQTCASKVKAIAAGTTALADPETEGEEAGVGGGEAGAEGEGGGNPEQGQDGDANRECTPLPDALINPCATLGENLQKIYKESISLMLLLAFLVLVYAGYRYVTSLGNPEATKDAKDWGVAAISGIALLLLIPLIMQALGITGSSSSEAPTSPGTNPGLESDTPVPTDTDQLPA